MFRTFALIAFASVAPLAAAQSIYIDTPGTHDLGSLGGDPFEVYVGMTSAGDLVSGVNGYIDSTASKQVDTLFMRSDSHVEYSSDHFATTLVKPLDQSSFYMSGGLLAELAAAGHSKVTFAGGYASLLTAMEQASMDAFGGSINNFGAGGTTKVRASVDAEQSNFSGSASIDVLGGRYGKAHLNGSSVVNVHDLTLGANFIAYDTSRMNVFGGSDAYTRYESYSGIVNFWGHDLVATYDRQGEASYQVSGAYWHLSGTLFDGSPVSNIEYFEAFGSSAEAKFLRLHNDAVPEPSTVAALSAGGLAFLRRKRKG